MDEPRERKEHVHSEGSVSLCRHCGGEVGEDGYSRVMADEAVDEGGGEVSEQIGGDTASQTETEQYRAVKKARDAAFTSAIKGRR